MNYQIQKFIHYYPLSQFNDIMSILRYEEKPLYLFLEKDGFKCGISTIKKPFEEKKKT